MRTSLVLCLLAALVLPGSMASAQAAERMLAHDVYFTLKQDSGEAQDRLLGGCKKYLTDHPGLVWFAAGVPVQQHQRDVNDRDFDVVLHMLFKDKASHDRYQDSDRHHKFIEEFQDSWKAVRVFDSYLSISSHGPTDRPKDRPDRPKDRPDPPKKPRLPDLAARFAGMLQGKVVAKFDSGVFALRVDKVVKQWRSSKAQDANSLLGKTVMVNRRDENGELVARFIAGLKLGQTITIDVAHRGEGEALTILESTEQQREKVK